ncbi:MAG TPA: DUF5063 domain-containing protein, partial [Actinomycetota bacterium]|nr:DUF5063 domain-containing protein [Actinomycetota bacterium]
AVQEFVIAVERVAAGGLGDSAIALLLIHTSQLAAHGARLGALTDVVPEGRYEPDTGGEPEVDDLRLRLAEVFSHADRYNTIDDPYFPAPEIVESSLSDDLSSIVTDLNHGFGHYAAGRPIEALWWWQYAYLSSWGEDLLNAHTALRSMISHIRLDLETR